LRITDEVPVIGSYLSGGLDSSTVICIARKLQKEIPVIAFSGAFREGKQFDETKYSSMIAKKIKAKHKIIYISCKDYIDNIEDVMWFMDEPSAGVGVVQEYIVAKHAANHVKVVFGGEGGDEYFLGYARYLIAYLEECLKGAIYNTAHTGRYVATLETIIPNLPDLEIYIPTLKSFWKEGLFDEPDKRYYRLMDRFQGFENIINPDLKLNRNNTFEEFRSIFNHHDAGSMINRIMYFDIKASLHALLQVDDRASIAWGLDCRAPLLDHRLAEFMAQVPPIIKFRNGRMKHLFRKAVKNIVPAEITGRKDKMGFPSPFSHWCKTGMKNFIMDRLSSKSFKNFGVFDTRELIKKFGASRLSDRTIWGALCLAIWNEKFINRRG
jgi:asparagine synthase (glutamine-hydrolysing)